MAVGGTPLKRQKRFLRLDFSNRGGRSARGVRGNSSPMFGSPRGGAWEGVRTASPKVPKGAGAYRARPWVGRGEYLGAPWGAHGKGCARQALSSRRAKGLTGRAPGWGGGKLQQARQLCPRITGAKGVNLVDMRY